MSLSNFQIISPLGEGAFSSVYKVKRLSDQQTYALKRVKLASLKQKEKENSLNEVRILASVNHPNIIAYKEAFIDEPTNTLCIVMELAEHGDLLSKIKNKKEMHAYFPESEIWDALVQICQGLGTLHESNILHRDLKGANIFISKEGVMKLGDLNVSKVNNNGLAYTQTGTPYYASPEVWQDKPYDWRSDIWSLGCVIYEMAALSPPFTASDMRGLYNKILSGVYPNILSNYSSDLSKVIRTMIQVTPALRPGCKDILSMPEVFRNNRFVFPASDNQPIDLLSTIRYEAGIKNINKKLPAANYESNFEKLSMPKIEEISLNSESKDYSDLLLKKANEIQKPSIPYLESLNSPKHYLPTPKSNSRGNIQLVKSDVPVIRVSDPGTKGNFYVEEKKLKPQIFSGNHRKQNLPPSAVRKDIYSPEIISAVSDRKKNNRGQVNSSGGRPISINRSKPEIAYYKAEEIVLQSPKKLLPKGYPKYQR